MDAETRWEVVESERRSLADLLDDLTPDQWEEPSLCSEWRVRDVAAHVAMTPNPLPLRRVAAGVLRARGDVWAFGRDLARSHAARPTADIVAELRSGAADRHLPSLTNLENLTVDVLVHGADITRPLGIDRPVPTEAGLAGFDRIWSTGWPFHARRRLAGLTLVASDAELRVGEGPVVEGRLVDLLLLVTGRTAAAVPHLTGPGVGRLSA